MNFTVRSAIPRLARLSPRAVLSPVSASADQMIMSAFGSRRVGSPNITMFTLFYGITRSQRNEPMPHQLEGFKIAERVGICPKRLAIAMMIATIVGVVSALWALLHSAYKTGVASGFTGYVGIPWESFRRLAGLMHYPNNTNSPELAFIGIGLTFSLTMMLL